MLCRACAPLSLRIWHRQAVTWGNPAASSLMSCLQAVPCDQHWPGAHLARRQHSVVYDSVVVERLV